MKHILCALAGLAATCSATARYTVITDSLTNSGIYPGTVHTYQITVPDDYTSDSPAALYLGLDGILCNAPEVIDSLMTAGKAPVTIGVFLQPGIVRDASGRVLRYNRSNEFDATDSRFSDFLANELLPDIETKVTGDGRRIKFTTNPAHRTVFGLSSGGIAAFTAAWHRPELFGRVMSGCGTFVPMRGGHNLQAIVRKHEPVPVRVFLQDGFDDCWNPTFGSWFDANVNLSTALRFAGTDLAVDWAEGVHSVRRATEIMPKALEWLWKDDNIAPGHTANDLLAPLLIDGAGWQPCSDTPRRETARMPRRRKAVPQAVYPDSTLLVHAAEDTNYLIQCILDDNGNPTFEQPFYWLHTYDNSVLRLGEMTFDGLGNLWVITSAGLQICDQNGRVRGILRLPPDLDITSLTLQLSSDGARISGFDSAGQAVSYFRRLHITPAVPGQRPKSQGQA